jgi:hypothetical protein
MFAQRTSIYLALLASLAVRQVAAHGYCVKFGVADVSIYAIQLGSGYSFSACRDFRRKPMLVSTQHGQKALPFWDIPRSVLLITLTPVRLVLFCPQSML